MIFFTVIFNIAGYHEIINLLIICFYIVFNGILASIGYYKTHLIEEGIILEQSLENLELLNSKLRKEKHDALNHIQIVNGLIELDEYEEAKQYLEKLFTSIEEINNTVKSNIGVLDALLASKYKELKGNKIDFYIDIQCSMDVSRLSDNEICLLIKELIRNLEVGFKRQGERFIGIKTYIDNYYEELIIEVSNNGDKIPQILNNPMPIEKLSKRYKKTKDEGYDFEKIWKRIYYINGRINCIFNNGENLIRVFIPLIKKEDLKV